jgi:hypothetical protein
VFTVRGNHEFPGLRYSEYLYPESYSFRIGKVNFIVVEKGPLPGVLERRVEEFFDESAFNVLVVHEPVFSCSKHSSDASVKLGGKLSKVLRDLGISLVVSSHDHNYHRVERDGVVQVMTILQELQEMM